MMHLELTGTRTRPTRVLPFPWPRGAGIRPRDGLVRALGNRPVGLGSVTWAGKHGSLALAPPFPTGGSQGNHLIFRWREAGATYFLGLHAWEPFLETVSTLRRIVGSIDAPYA